MVQDVDDNRKVAARVIKNQYKALCGKYHDPNLTYDVVEETVDRLLTKNIGSNKS